MGKGPDIREWLGSPWAEAAEHSWGNSIKTHSPEGNTRLEKNTMGGEQATEDLRTTEERNNKSLAEATLIMCESTSPTHLAPPRHTSPSDLSDTRALT